MQGLSGWMTGLIRVYKAALGGLGLLGYRAP